MKQLHSKMPMRNLFLITIYLNVVYIKDFFITNADERISTAMPFHMAETSIKLAR